MHYVWHILQVKGLSVDGTTAPDASDEKPSVKTPRKKQKTKK